MNKLSIESILSLTETFSYVYSDFGSDIKSILFYEDDGITVQFSSATTSVAVDECDYPIFEVLDADYDANDVMINLAPFIENYQGGEVSVRVVFETDGYKEKYSGQYFVVEKSEVVDEVKMVSWQSLNKLRDSINYCMVEHLNEMKSIVFYEDNGIVVCVNNEDEDKAIDTCAHPIFDAVDGDYEDDDVMEVLLPFILNHDHLMLDKGLRVRVTYEDEVGGVIEEYPSVTFK